MSQNHSARHGQEFWTNMTNAQQFPSEDPNELVASIRAGCESGMENLYRLFRASVKPSLARSLGDQDAEDRVHDLFLLVVQSIREGELRDPQRLFGFIHAVTRRQVATIIEKLVLSRKKLAMAESVEKTARERHDPEMAYARVERARLIRDIFAALDDRQREVLRRFYLEEQPVNEICHHMRLSDTQFRLLKSRAKARFGELGRLRQIPPGKAA